MWVRLVPVPAGFRVLCFVGGIDVVLMGTVLSAAGVSGVFRVSAMHRRSPEAVILTRCATVLVITISLIVVDGPDCPARLRRTSVGEASLRKSSRGTAVRSLQLARCRS